MIDLGICLKGMNGNFVNIKKMAKGKNEGKIQ